MPKDYFKIVPAVYLILIQDNKILLLKRCNTGFHDGDYSFPAGHVDGNETLVQATIREAKEEIGIDVEPRNLRLIHVMHRKQPSHERADFFFTTPKWTGEIKNMEPHKCVNLNWCDMDNLPLNTIPYIKQTINCIKNNIIYSEAGWTAHH